MGRLASYIRFKSSKMLLHTAKNRYIMNIAITTLQPQTRMGGISHPMHQRQKPLNIIIDTVLVVVVAILLGLSVRFFGINVSIAATLLVGIWVLDAFLKRTYGFDSDTIFADLTLASFGYSVSYAVGLLSQNMNSFVSEAVLNAFILTFIIFLTWVANISLCRIFRMRPPSIWLKRLAWIFSVLIGLFSVFVAFYPLFIR